MERVSFVLQIRPEDREEYIRRHQHVYPELLQAFGEVGIHTYSIFLRGGELFAYMEVDDYDAAMEKLAVHEASQRWEEYMSDLLFASDEGSTREIIPEVFHYHS